MRCKCFLIDQAVHNVCRIAVHHRSHHSSHRDDHELHEARMMISRLGHNHNWFAATDGEI